jgi:hypothetical protein
MHAPEPAPPQLPAWLRRTHGEHRWPAALAVVVTIGLQLVLPDRMVPQAHYLLLALEGALLVALVVANPFRINLESALLRTSGLALTTLVGLSNGWSAVLLVLDLVAGRPSSPELHRLHESPPCTVTAVQPGPAHSALGSTGPTAPRMRAAGLAATPASPPLPDPPPRQ